MNYLSINGKLLETAVAITQEEQVNGLMFVKEAFPMCFPMTVGIKKFWMKNTFVPLDIIFSLGGSITKIEYGEPFNINHIGPDTPTDLVIELPYGTAKEIGASVGSKVKIIYDKHTIIKKMSARLTEVGAKFLLC